ncbi:hypothetical protein OJAV_G00027320 [Oryzias javanicus]|uniref:Ribonuclease P protein subunit p29 n=1 Tax=Oryzias javanicus TaxID=123683 RepID=A0A3S2MUV9_ORYJA|nr:hypothetical protein OJAV_G00027320 [Oryzias javanicus]
MEEKLVQAPLPGDLRRILGVEPQRSSKAAAFTEAFLACSLQHPHNYDLKTLLTHKAVVLGSTRSKKPRTKRSSKKAKGLTAQQKKALKVFQIRPEHRRYQLFLPLHDLWRQYVRDLCGGLRPSCSPQFVQQKLLRADLHGAIITVVRSKCPSYVGVSGILLQEFKHVFKIITADDRLKVIPKRNSVFSVEVDGFVSHIFGSRFEQRASERSAKKFKVHGTIDL